VVYRLALAFAGTHGWLPGGVVQTVVLPNLLPGRWAEFVFGMITAEALARGWIERLPAYAGYLWVPVLPVAIVAVSLPLSHVGFGVLFGLLLVAALTHGNPVNRIFAWRPLVALGIMSYSIYLVHQPLIQAAAHVVRTDLGFSPTGTFAMLVALLPVVIGIAWLLFVAVERYTLTSRPVEVTGLAAAFLFPGWGRLQRAVAPVEAGISARSV
jgi:peptidoglycan/LPS O-acetylase OafA/YrhL